MITYLIGAILVFFIIRFTAKQSNDWNDRTYFIAFIYAIGSWISFVFLLALFIYALVKNK